MNIDITSVFINGELILRFCDMLFLDIMWSDFRGYGKNLL